MGKPNGNKSIGDIMEDPSKEPLLSFKYEESINSSNGSINSTSNGLVIGMSKAQASVSATNTFTLGESPGTNNDKDDSVVSSFRSLATGSNINGAEMLSHRKSKKKHLRTTSTSSNVGKSLPDLPSTPMQPFSGSSGPDLIMSPSSSSYLDYDKTLYVDELYLDTQYRYATQKRNDDFHTLFSSVPADDRLLDDFSCALNREILLQGRIYISEHYICFYSSLFGWVTTNPSLVLSHDEITKFEKRSTAGLFPNGISIETKESTHTFASFLTRDQTLNFIETIWSKSLALSELNNEKPRDIEIVDPSMTLIGGLSEQDIYTIDGDSFDSSADGVYTSENDSEDSIQNSRTALDLNQNEKTPLVNQNSSFESTDKFPGPETHFQTKNPVDYAKNNEYIVLEDTFDVPLGLLFKLYFGNDTSFHKRVLELSDGSNFTNYEGLEEDKQRTFEFDKGLNYPIGPKSTRVYMEENVVNFDFDDYIEILNISKTPNVPSGGAFDCRTRYVFSWDENSKTKLTVSYYLNWTGSSWIKSVIESSAQSGQKKAGEDVKKVLDEAIEQQKEQQQKQQTFTKPKRVKSKSRQKKVKKDQTIEELETTKANAELTNIVLSRLNTIVRVLILVIILEFIIILALFWNQFSKNIN